MSIDPDFEMYLERLPTLEDLIEDMKDEEQMVVKVSAVVSLLDQLNDLRRELNDYHIRDAEMEGWMSLPRSRYLRLLGLELENEELLRHEEIDFAPPEQDRVMIEQPPEEEDFCTVPPIEELFEIKTNGTSNPADFFSYRVYGSSSNPVLFRDTVILSEEEIEEITKEVLRRIDELGKS